VSFKFYPQHDQMDCGPACLRMISKYYGKKISLQYLRDNSFLTREGVSLLGITEAATRIGFETYSVKCSLEKLVDNIPLPSIIHWNQNHFVVLYDIKRNYISKKLIFKVADPGFGIIKLSEEEFKKNWENEEGTGIALCLKPTDSFYNKTILEEPKSSFKALFDYLKPYKKDFLKLSFGLFIGSLITLLFPFLTQALIDKGVISKSLHIVFLILLAQIFLFIGTSFIEIVRNWILLHIGTKINIKIVSNFLTKIMKLPISFFDSKMMGDFTQRIGDHERIEEFLTSQSLFILFSLINFSVFFIVLGVYDIKILMIYLLLTIISVIWVVLFLNKRKNLDYVRFRRQAENQDSIYELINGVQEIKLNDFESFKRKEWENIQLKLFKINRKILSLDQYQSAGFTFINHLKNIIVTYIAAREVILGNVTLGGMLSISYIIGQMNGPIDDLIFFFRSLQNARISFDRMGEIHNQKNEENQKLIPFNTITNTNFKDITIANAHFQYEGPQSPHVIKNLNLTIPEGKITAIVGASGSGKTTLMKLLLGFYPLTNGSLCVKNTDLSTLSPKSWRNQCGVVMQDGYIFSDSIERNIATGSEEINQDRLIYAIKTANLTDFIESLPLGFKTKVGASGNGISGGQKQRILIARAVYKNPNYLFFDEATSALDADNEKVIIENLNQFFKGKTVVVIAHRLSTVKNADQIIVLNKGEAVEQGNHLELVKNKQHYYHLVKNQLELGN